MELSLIREGSFTGIGVMGTLHCAGFTFNTVEREWVNNEPFVSCIPLGRYKLVKYSSKKYPNHYALVNEEVGVYAHKGDIPEGEKGRYAILIHIANTPSQLAGCIAPGMERGYLNGSKVSLAVLKSTPAFNTIIARLDSESRNFITITEEFQSW